MAGDFNIIPSAEDVYNPKSFEDDALFRLEIRKKLLKCTTGKLLECTPEMWKNWKKWTIWNLDMTDLNT